MINGLGFGGWSYLFTFLLLCWLGMHWKTSALLHFWLLIFKGHFLQFVYFYASFCGFVPCTPPWVISLEIPGMSQHKVCEFSQVSKKPSPCPTSPITFHLVIKCGSVSVLSSVDPSTRNILWPVWSQPTRANICFLLCCTERTNQGWVTPGETLGGVIVGEKSFGGK